MTAAGFAVADQAVFSGTNFLVSVMLARWLPEQQFGEFAVAYSVYLLIAALHTAVTSEPMQILGAGRFGHILGRFLALTLLWHALVTGVAAVAVSLTILAVIDRSTSLGHTLLTMAASIPVLLIYWVVRRAFYIRAQSHLAALSSIVYLLAALAGAAALHNLNLLSARSAFAVLAAASLMATLAAMPYLRFRWIRQPDDPSFAALAAQYVAYGKWSGPTMFVSWVPHNVFYVALPAFASIEAAGALRALTNLIMPMQNVLVACSSLVLPAMASRFETGGHQGVRQLGRRAIAILGTLACLHFVVLLAAGDMLVSAVYHDRYSGTALEQIVLALVPIAYVPLLIYDDALRATNRMAPLFRSYAMSAVIALTAGMVLVSWFGLLGATLAVLLAAIASGGAMAYHYRRLPA